MMSLSEGIELNESKDLVESTTGIKNIHQIHLWKMNDNDTHLEAYVEVDYISVR